MTVTKGSIPQIHRGVQQDFKKLFYSLRDIALILEKSFQSGYGILEMGMVVGLNAANGKLVPNPLAAHDDEDIAIALALASLSNGASTVLFTAEDGYKFQVGDSLIMRYIKSSVAYYQDCGAITDIVYTDRTATVTFTTVISGAEFTTAQSCCGYVKTDTTTSTDFKKALYICEQSLDTGVGEDALGAIGSVVVSNAILYKGELVNYDSQALADLGATEDGQFLTLK